MRSGDRCGIEDTIYTMAFRHLGGSPKKALPGQMLLVVRKCQALLMRMFNARGWRSKLLVSSFFSCLRRDTNLGWAHADGKITDDFEARSPDELSLQKGERIELIERDDDFGDGWYLGKHVQNGRVGLFPEGKSPSLQRKFVRNGLF